jgi:IS30 family transposase
MCPTYSFPEAVVVAISRDRYRHPDPRVQERMEILWHKSQNEPRKRIAELANVSRSTVQRTLRIRPSKASKRASSSAIRASRSRHPGQAGTSMPDQVTDRPKSGDTSRRG